MCDQLVLPQCSLTRKGRSGPSDDLKADNTSRRPNTDSYSLDLCPVKLLPDPTVSVTGTLKHVKSSVARAGGIVLRWSNGYGTGG